MTMMTFLTLSTTSSFCFLSLYPLFCQSVCSSFHSSVLLYIYRSVCLSVCISTHPLKFPSQFSFNSHFYLIPQAIVLITDGSSVSYPQGLAVIAKSLREAGVKVVVVLVGDADKGLDNVKPLASEMDLIVTVGSPDRLKVMVQPAVDKILQGN